MTKEATARIKINRLLESAGWRFFADGNDAANIRLEPSVTIRSTDLDALGENFENIERGFVDFLLLDAKGFPLLVLEAKAEAKSPLVAAIVEVGNHIAHVANGAHRRAAAQRVVKEVRSALADEAPWKPINFPSNEEVLCWLDAFPDSATKGVGMGDLSIRQEWESCCHRYAMSRVWVWTLDRDLVDLDRPARRR